MTADEVFVGLSADKKDAVVAAILVAAEEFFEVCIQDFCIQTFGEERIVFGGHNRLIWTAKRGFFVDGAYCTDKFLAHAEKVMGR
jgi:hypothetical protein